MKLIFAALLLASAFFTFIEASSDSSSSISSQGSTGREPRRENSKGPSASKTSKSEESESSRASRINCLHRSGSPVQQEGTSRYAENSENSRSRVQRQRSRHSGPSRYVGHSGNSRSSGQRQNSRHSGPSRPRIIYRSSGTSSSAPEPAEDSRSVSPLENRFSGNSERSQVFGQEQPASPMMPTPPHPYSPSGPFSYPYNSPSRTSDAGSNNVSPDRSH